MTARPAPATARPGARTGQPDPAHGFLDALHADGPAPALGEAADVYGWLVGSWDMHVVDYKPDGSRRESRGEWHFGWVLEGRAIQDVFIVPPRDARDGDLPAEGNRYGTSIRVYDARIGAWRVAWINPVIGWEDHLLARRVGDDVVQEGRRADGSLIRWCFVDITPDSFTWRGERSTDDGASWRLEFEFTGRRVAPPAGNAAD